MSYDDVMEKTGKNNKVFVSSYQGPFLNSDSIIVEYEDVLESPEMLLLTLIINEKVDFSDSFIMDEINDLHTMSDISNWYIHRKKKSLFDNFPMTDKLIEALHESNEYDIKNFTNQLVNHNLEEFEFLTDNSMNLNFYDTLKSIDSTSMVKKIIIFSKYSENVTRKIESRMRKEFDEKVIFAHGLTFKEVLKKFNVSNNSTFVFSDVNYITELMEENKLEYSSILITDSLKYNYKNDDELIIPIEEYIKSNICKINFFNNFYTSSN